MFVLTHFLPTLITLCKHTVITVPEIAFSRAPYSQHVGIMAHNRDREVAVPARRILHVVQANFKCVCLPHKILTGISYDVCVFSYAIN
jgi:hypothetical protein